VHCCATAFRHLSTMAEPTAKQGFAAGMDYPPPIDSAPLVKPAEARLRLTDGRFCFGQCAEEPDLGEAE
jgi:hypothetical protein